VHDGPGIRTLVFFKGCPLHCAWCCNPESQAFGPELTHLSARCDGCLSCAMACPDGAIDRGPDGPLYMRQKCRVCQRWQCTEACPRSALARVGRTVSADEVMARVSADVPFYSNSGGGVTFSGGEPFTQPEFLGELLDRCRSLKIRAAVETCGYVSQETLLGLEPLVGLFLFDVKAMSPEVHAHFTGSSNEAILNNLRALARKAGDRIIVRVPLVPGCTDSRENLEAIAEMASGLGLLRVEFMPYHELGRDKYANLGREYPIIYEGFDPAPNVGLALEIFASKGFACTVSGE
jgi:pyruvate formate lyase activating enzyme